MLAGSLHSGVKDFFSPGFSTKGNNAAKAIRADGRRKNWLE